VGQSVLVTLDGKDVQLGNTGTDATREDRNLRFRR
jgi:hypothetical protein